MIVREQLDSPRYADDLIDVMVKVLSSPKCATVLTGSFLSTLRGALLRPTEIAKVRAMAEVYQGCHNCGEKIFNGEIVSFHDQNVLCVRCLVPELAPCGGCKRKLNLPGISRIISKITKECGYCQQDPAIRSAASAGGAAGATVSTPPASPAVAPDWQSQLPLPPDIVNVMRGNRAAAAAPRTNAPVVLRNDWGFMDAPGTPDPAASSAQETDETE